MAQEIERKFTLKNEDWRQLIERSEDYRQGYLAGNERASIRVRIAGDSANLNIKSATLGIFRQEYEYTIPLDEAQEMLDKLAEKPVIEKTRHFLCYGKHLWVIDEFYGDNTGLVVAELELDDINEQFEIPEWIEQEVSGDPRYYNVSLVKNPFKLWSENT